MVKYLKRKQVDKKYYIIDEEGYIILLTPNRLAVDYVMNNTKEFLARFPIPKRYINNRE